MRKHNMALTYAPKIDPVRRNEIKQTIRSMRAKPIEPGDIINFHGWLDKAYRSPWTSRKKVIVKSICLIMISTDGINVEGVLYPWEHPSNDMLAKMDGIRPATGEALRDVLFGLNGAPDEPQEYQIIRWS